MSMTVNDLIKLLDTEENRYGGATGKPRELNISINDKFCGNIESVKLDGHGDGLVTEVTLCVEAPEAEEYYEQEIRDKAIDEFVEKLYEASESVRPVAWTTRQEVVLLKRVQEIAEQSR